MKRGTRCCICRERMPPEELAEGLICRPCLDLISTAPVLKKFAFDPGVIGIYVNWIIDERDRKTAPAVAEPERLLKGFELLPDVTLSKTF